MTTPSPPSTPQTNDSRDAISRNGNSPVNNADNLARIEDLIHNTLSSRADFFKGLMDPRRSIDDECGYPSAENPHVNPELYQQLYTREPVAARVVEVLPRESWKVPPSVYEVEDSDKKTAFEEAWDNLSRSLRGDNYYQDECGSPVWEVLLRADILSGIGHYGVIVLGLDDTDNFELPTSNKPGTQLLYLTVLPESLAPITRFETDVRNPRFGQPLEYTVTFNDTRNQADSSQTIPTNAVKVHHSRVIHVADNIGSSTTLGMPRMEQVLNRLLDLRKLYGGSAEMYWRGALPGWAFETHPSLGGDVAIDRTSLLDQFENYSNGLQRYLALMGMTAKSLAPQVVDPTPQIAVQIEAICVRLAVPVRIFKGSERGELASSQDAAAWNDRLRERQLNYITPRIVIPFVNRLIQTGVLPEPKGFSVHWPVLDSLSVKDKAVISVQQTNALALYVKSQLYLFFSPADFLTRVMWYTQSEAKSIIEQAQVDNPLIDLMKQSALATPNSGNTQMSGVDTVPGLGQDPTGKTTSVADSTQN